MKKPPCCVGGFYCGWLRELDSNQRYMIQSHVCYRYTIPQYLPRFRYYHNGFRKVKGPAGQNLKDQIGFKEEICIIRLTYIKLKVRRIITKRELEE